MSSVKNRPRRTPKVPYKIRSIQSGDSNDSFFGRISSPILASNGFEDISSDSNSSFDQTEFEVKWLTGSNLYFLIMIGKLNLVN